IDPLDGTTNFIHKIPYCSTAIALKHKGETIFSVINDPINNELFYAEYGKGAFLFGEEKTRRLRVKEATNTHEWFMAFCCPDSTKNEEAEKIVFDTFYPITLRLSKLGSASLEFAYVAAGRLDAYVGIKLKEWDVLPGELLVREAGGVVETGELIGKKLIIGGAKENVHRIKGLVLHHEHYDEPPLF
ncbi:inositol monophosphatase, partial [Candidatus Micrarchaeota archaeon]|nr:inositol monophosphatase [Candidatus Micrarchaeota archaeon]